MKSMIPPTASFLAVFGLLVIAVVLVLLFFFPVPEANKSTVDLVLGAALGWVGATYSFFYGSNKSSQTKDDTIAALTTAVGGTGTGNGAIAPTTSITGPTPPTTGGTEP